MKNACKGIVVSYKCIMRIKIVLLYLDLGRRQYAKVAARKSRTEYNAMVELSTEYNPRVERPGFRPAQTKWQAPWGVEHEDAYSV